MSKRTMMEDVYPLTPMQEGMLFHSLYAPDEGMYVGQLGYVLEGDLDASALERAWNDAVGRHEALRAGFAWKGMPRPLQVIRRRVEVPFRHEDLRGLDAAERAARLEAYLDEDRRAGFDLSRAPLMRVSLFRTAEREHQLLWTHHHLILDGWSLPILFRDVLALYDAHRRGAPAELGPAPRYRDYVAWLAGRHLGEAEAFWRESLAGFTAPTPLPLPRPCAGDGLAKTALSLSPGRTAEMGARCRALGITPGTLMQGAWALLLSRYAGEEDVVFGSTVSGRPAELAGVEETVGLFINTLPVRVRVDGGARVGEWLDALLRSQARAREHAHVPLPQVRRWSDVPAGEALFESLLVFENFPFDRALGETVEGLRVRQTLSLERTNFPFLLTVVPGERLEMRLQYDRARAGAATAEQLLRHLDAVLASMLADPARRLRDVSPLRAEERARVLEAWNATEAAYPSLCVHERFAEQAARTPDAPAVVFGDEVLTYAELDRRTNRLARRLRRLGVGPDVPVGLCLERGPELVAGVLGILKAGGAYVPLDPAHPAERLAYTLADAGVPAVLTQSRLAERLAGFPGALVRLDEEPAGDADDSGAPLESGAGPRTLAYVLYTSGSTGMPKGVLVEHRGLSNYLQWFNETVLGAEGFALPLVSRVAFDAHVRQLFPPLLRGEAVWVLPEETIADARALVATLATRDRVSFGGVPSLWSAVLELIESGTVEKPAGLQAVLLGGEAIPAELPERTFRAFPGVAMWNHYGPTEATVNTTVSRVQPGEPIRIGRPVANVRVYVLDRDGGPVPVGVPGEVYVGGIGVSRGYLGRPALTAERFVPDPFAAEAGARMYRSGDRARWAAEGELEYLGRIDFQVKIRGFRVELGEIEAVLRAEDGIRDAVAALREDVPGQARIVAYVVTEGGEADAGALKSALQGRLPEHMVPSAFVPLERLPLNANGKVDRRALPAPEWESEEEYVAPRTEAEEILCAVWADVLRVERVGVHDDYFALGGDSILSIQIVSRARQRGLRISPRDVFERPSVERLAQAAEAGERAPAASAEQEPITGEAPLTPAQHRFFARDLRAPHHFNQALLLAPREALDPALVEGAITALLEHHDALRLRFRRDEAGAWTQTHAPVGERAPVEAIDLSGLAAEARAGVIESHAERAQRSLDLQRGPLLRAVGFATEAGRVGRLLIVIHHLVVDGVSWRILVEDLETAYGQLSRGEPVRLPAKTTSWKAWAKGLAREAVPAVEAEASYWLGEGAREVPPLSLDDPAAENTPAAGGTVTVRLDAAETEALLREVPAAYRTQIDDVLLCALARTLSRWTGAPRMRVDLEGHGREEALVPGADLSRTVGWFTSVYPVVLELPDGGEGAALKAVKEQLRAVPRRGMGYGLLRWLGNAEVREALADAPGAEVSFNYLGQLDAAVSGDAFFGFAPEPAGAEVDPAGPRAHRLAVTAAVRGGRLEVTLGHGGGHRRATVEGVAAWYAQDLRALVAHCTSAEAGGCTPSDFPLAALGQGEVDALLGDERGVEDVYPITPMQEGMLFHALYAPGEGVYVSQFGYALEGELDAAAMQRAWGDAVARHEALRASFAWQGVRRPLQVIHRAVDVPFRAEDWRALAPAERDARREAYLAEDRRAGFDLSRAPVMRVALFRTGEREHQLVWTHHHLVMDGWSLPLLFRDVLAFYDGHRRGQPVRLGPAPRYRDYVAWLAGRDLAAAEAHWRGVLAGFAAPTPLPLSRLPEEGIARVALGLPPERTAALQGRCRALGITPGTLLQGAWGLLLARYAGEDDAVFGATVSGRPAELAGVEETVGLFINTLPVRVRAGGPGTVGEWLARLQEQQVRAREHEHVPVTQVRRWSEVPAGESLFDTLLVFENYPFDPALAQAAAGLRARQTLNREQTNFPLLLAVLPGERLELRLQYDRARVAADTAERMLAHLDTLLASLVADPSRRLSGVSLLSDAERTQVLRTWNATDADYPPTPVHALFAAQAARTPERRALVFRGQALTYAELDARANRLAHHLRRLGVGPEVRVGICLEREMELVVGMLAVLKAGGAYVPLDPAYPPGRLAFMVADAGAPVVLARRRSAGWMAEDGPRGVWMEDEETWAHEPSAAAPEPGPGPENLSHVIYTSGSTGRPKGVMVRHGATSVLLHWMRDTFSDEDRSGVLASTSVSFDVSVAEIFGALCWGGTLVLADSALELADVPADPPVRYASMVPTAAAELLRAGRIPRSLRTLVLAGEALPNELAQALYGLDHLRTVGNAYGPTEDTSYSTWWAVERGAPGMLVGRALANTRTYVLDREMRPVPPGVMGELYLAGAGLARGYLGRPALTAERFVPDPFGAPGGRMYRVMDRMRWTADGQLEYRGRIDFQVKVRGHRVEPGEVESALRTHPDVWEAVVVAREDEPGHRRLVAYVVPRGGAQPAGAALRAHLRSRLPDFMVPAAFVLLDRLPLNANDKLDRAALPAPAWAAADRYVAPATEMESLLAGVWAETLRLERVGVEHNFFELGGDSILAIQLVSRAREQGVRITPRQLFEHATVARLAEVAARIGDGDGAEADAGEAAEAAEAAVTGPAPLTPAQRWFLTRRQPSPHHFNQALLLAPREGLDPSLLEPAVAALLAHHDALRLRFRRHGAGAWTASHGPVEPGAPVEVVDLSHLPQSARAAAIESRAAEAQRSLDLEHGPLLRAVAFVTRDGRAERLLVVIHHLVVDGVSWRILLQDLETAYGQLARGQAVRLPARTTSWKAWAERLAADARSPARADEAEHWLEQAAREVPPLPLDDPAGANTAARARSVSVRLDAAETESLLREVPAAYRTQIDDVLLCALARAVERWTGSPRMRVELEGHGREEDAAPGVDLSRTVGWFTTMYPVVLELPPGADEGAALRAVKAQLRAVPGRGLGHGLLRHLGDPELAVELAAAPAAEIGFNYLGQFDGAVSGDAFFGFAPEPAGPATDPAATRMHRLEVAAAVCGGRLEVTFGYAEGVHRAETVERVAAEYAAALRGLIAHCASPDAGGYTPRDFPLAGLAQGEIDALLGAERGVEDVYPLTPLQEGILFHTLYAPEGRVYLGQFGYVLEGGLDAAAMERAWAGAVARHEALRAAFAWEGLPHPVQVIRRAVDLPFRHEDLRGVDEGEREARLAAFLAEDRAAGMDPSRAPLMRIALFRTGDREHHLLWTHHHLILDGWSLPVLFRDVLALYDAHRRGEPARLGTAPRYRDYVAWLQGRDLGEAEAFWRGALAGFTAPTPLSLPRPPGEGEGIGRVETQLSPARTAALQARCRSLEITPGTLVHGAWALLLSRYSGEDDVLFGVTASGRPAELEGVDETVGLFINTLPARVRVPGGATAGEWLAALQREQARAREHQHVPLVQLRRWSEVPAGEALFESLVSVQNYPFDQSLGTVVEGLRARTSLGVEQTNIPFVLTVGPGERLQMRLQYHRARAAGGAAERMLAHLEAVVEALVADPARPLRDVSPLRAEERARVLEAWNATEAAYPSLCVHERFAEQAARTPDAPAVVFGDEVLTYAELDRRTNRLARRLRALGVGPDVPVGLCLERGPELVAGVLGILKAGGAYVPLDPAHPAERLAYTLADAGAPAVLTQSRLAERLAGFPGAVVPLDEEQAGDAEDADAPLESGAGPRTLAYVLYTSGSTGMPKGVLVEHRGLSNYLQWFDTTVLGAESFALPLVSRVAFDAHVRQLFPPLLRGEAVWVLPEETITDARALVATLATRDRVSFGGVPSLWSAVLELIESGTVEKPAGLQAVLLGGEAIPAELPERTFRAFPGVAMWNHYGPTEATVNTTVSRVQPGEPIRIGRPVANVRVYVLDRDGGPVPVGVPGEVYVGGIGVSRGYLGRPGLTAERFVPDPFAAEAGARMYRSGDRARWAAEGELEYLGRIDFQVKIRGFRVELGEIEAVLRAQPGIRDAVAVLREDVPGQARIVAYVVTEDEADAGALKSALQGRLPEHMVPSAFVPLERLPLNANGKVDRRALPAPEWESEEEYVAPRTEAEEILCAVWADVLRVERVGVRDDYFALGGDSILSIQIVSRARQRGLRISPRDVFERPSVERLAQAAEAGERAPAASAEQEPITGEAPLTPAQHRFFARDLRAPHHFNQALLLAPREALDPALVEGAIAALLAHHDALRLRFRRDEAGAWTQTHAPVGERAPLEAIDLSGLAAEARAGVIESHAAGAQRRLNLEGGPLLRAVGFATEAGRVGRLLIVIHHLVVDGVSWRILVEDLETAYGQLSRGEPVRLPAKTTSWKAWAERLDGEAAPAAEAEAWYWREEGARQVPPLPLDDPAAPDTAAHARTVAVRLDAAETGTLLREVPAAYRTQIDDVLLCALAQALGRWTGAPRVRVDLEGHGREEELAPGADLSRTVGWFTSVYPVVLELPDGGPGAALKAVKEQLRAVPRRGACYGLLRWQGNAEVRAALADAPAAEVSFNYLGQFDQSVSGDAFFGFAPESAGPATDAGSARAHRLEVGGAIRGGRLEVGFGFAEGVLLPETVERVAADFADALRALIAHCASAEAGGYTPSDFPLAALAQDEVDALLGGDRGVEDVYPLTPMQEGMLFHALYAPDEGVYVSQFGYVLEGEVDAAAMQRAWSDAVARHDALRAAFAWQGVRRPVQVIRRGVEVPFRAEDWRALRDDARAARLAAFLAEDREAGIDLARAPLMRVALFRTGDAEHHLVWTHHHLVMDGWSLPLLLRDVLTLYDGHRRGEPARLGPAPRYGDYVAWLQRQDVARAEAFWRHSLADFTAPTPLPVRRVPGEEGAAKASLRLAPERTEALQAWARGLGLTASTVLQGAWALLLARYAGEDDVLFGATVSGRPVELAGVEATVGLFINTLPVRVRAAGDAVLGAWLAALQEEQTQAREHEHVPLVQVRRWSDVPAGEALFESLVAFENYPLDRALAETVQGLRARASVSVEQTNYPLVLAVIPGDGLEMRLQYDRARVSVDTADRLLRHLDTLLESMAGDPARRLRDLALLRADERARVLEAWNDTAAPLPRAGVHTLFAEQAARAPDAPAVVFGDATVAYGELADRAGRLANHLRAHGVGAEARVALCMERGVDAIVAMLGILQAGGAYVPVDDQAPPERVREIIADAGCVLTLTHAAWSGGIPGHPPAIRVDDPETAAAIAALPATPPSTGADPDQLAYVIYTSGSTGRPKGVAVPHRAVVRLVRNTNYASFGPGERVAQASSIAFDAATFEVWGALLNGGTLVVFPAGAHSLAEVGTTVRAQGVTTLWLTAGLFHWMVDENLDGLRGLRQLLAGGDVLSPAHVRRVRDAYPALRLINGYGPTENTTFTCCHTVDGGVDLDATVPIGAPIAGTRVYVVDAHGTPAPVGVPGELLAGGEGVARGYLGRPALTAERFVPDPFSGRAGARLYRTGDRVRWKEFSAEPDRSTTALTHSRTHALEYIGRTDVQVKVRGFRVEPGEIEAALRAQPEVREAAVVAREDVPGQRRLVAYVVAGDGASPAGETLRARLRERLPEYMVPAAFVTLDALPLTRNGKVDTRALPAPEWGGGDGYVPPATPMETLLAGVWSDVLRVEQVGAEDNFFELGGDSILAIQLVSRARRQGVRITPRQLFEQATVARLAEVATRIGADADADTGAARGPVTGAAPLTPVQRWFLEGEQPAAHHFNQALLLAPRERLDPSLVQQAVAALLAHHDALRLRFRRDGTGAWTASHAPAEAGAPVEVMDLSHLPESARAAAIESRAAEAQRSLDLEHGPLLRAVAFVTREGRAERLLIVIHHLVVDGVSWRILLQDLEEAYAQLERGGPVRLPARTTSWQEWAERLALAARAPERADELAYWVEQSARAVPPLPLDDPAGENVVGRSRSVSLRLEAAETEALLREVPAAYRTQIDDVLLCALARTLERWTGSPRVRVELEGHGREEDAVPGADLSRTVGWFTSIYPVVLELPPGADEGAALKAVKEQLRGVPGRGLGHGLLRWLGDPAAAAALASAPAAEVGFNYLGQLDAAVSDDAFFRFAPESAGAATDPRSTRMHRLEVGGAIREGRLEVTFGYAEGVHRARTVERVAADYADALRALIAHCTSAEAGGHTPSDFPLAALTQGEVDALLGSGRGVEDVYPVTSMQEGMLFDSLYAPGEGLYVSQFVYLLEGELDAAALARAWDDVVARHEALRASFAWDGVPRPLQVIRRGVEVPFRQEDLRGLDAEARDGRRAAFLAEDRRAGFGLSRAPLMRVALFRTGEREHELVWTHHHLVVDGWSLPLIFRDVLALYEGHRRGQPVRLGAAPRYRDYVAWLQRRDPSESEAWWRGALAGFAAPTALPLERGPGEGIASLTLFLPPERAAALGARCRGLGITLGALVQGAWALLLSRYSGEDDVLFGATVSGRPAELAGVEEAVGLFINTLPVRVRVPGDAVAGDWLAALQEEGVRAREHQHVPLVQVRGWSDVPFDQALFETLVAVQNFPLDPMRDTGADGLRVRPHLGLEQTSFPFVLSVKPGERLQVRLQYDRARASAPAAERMLGHLDAVLEWLVADTARPLRDVSLLREEERAGVLAAGGAPSLAYPRASLHALFAAQAARTPHATAVIHHGEARTYAELERMAAAVAGRLRRAGVAPGMRVALCAERSPGLVAGILGILRAGAAWVPVDPGYPAERIAWMLEDSGCAAVLAGEGPRTRLPADARPRVLVLEDALAEEAEDGPVPPVAVDPESAAYVVYTSGSTGRPKGVLGTHRATVNRLAWQWDAYPYAAGEVCAQKTGIGFVDSVAEILGPLLAGVPLALIGDEAAREPERLMDALAAEGCTRIVLVPSLLRALLEAAPELGARLPALRTWVCSGERLDAALVRAFSAAVPGAALLNLYGSSEVAADVTGFDTRGLRAEDDAVPIGRPIANTRIHVLDAALRLVPPGLPGEICAGGDGVALGYLHRPALTAEKFVPDPFGPPGARMYRTGDRGRFRPDGTLLYLGRADHQVKIRGLRIELGEIEAVLAAHPDVRLAVADVRERVAGEPFLAAWIVARNGDAPSSAELESWLRDRLPEYMVPRALVTLDALPLGPTGKLDRRALPSPRPSAEGFVAPRTQVEAVLAGIWAEVLRVERIGAGDHFFALGGHSLLATQVVTRVRGALGVDVALRDVFREPTLAGLAALVDARRAGAAPADAPLRRVARPGVWLPLSFAQQRLWFLQRMDPESRVYNQVLAYRLQGRLDRDALRRALGELVRRHAVFRTRFEERGGEPGQVIHPPREWTLPLIDLAGAGDGEAALAQVVREQARRLYDLSGGELLRTWLARLSETEHALVVGLHHITNDGWSVGILAREVVGLYHAFSQGRPSPFAELPVQYADFAAWQRAWLTPERERAQLDYWRARLAGLPDTPLSADRAGPAGATEGETRRFALTPALSEAVRRLSRRLGATPFMTLLAAFEVLLHWQGGGDEVVVGTDIANRNLRAETEGLIGFFVNQLVLRTDLRGNPDFAGVVGRVREETLAAYDHQDVPFDRVVEALRPRRAAGETPFFRVKFVLQNAPGGEPVQLPGLALQPIASERGAAQVDLMLVMHDGGDRFRGAFEHRTSRLSPELVARWGRRLGAVLEAAVEDPARRLDELRARLDGEERREREAAQEALKARRQARFVRRGA